MSDQHFLIVHEHLDDGMEVEHPPTCPRTGEELWEHGCAVGQHVDFAGLSPYFHRVGDPERPDPQAEHVAVGRHPIEAWVERISGADFTEWDAGLCLSPSLDGA